MKTDGPIKSKQRPITAREAALNVLNRVEQDEAYSNLALNQVLQKYELDNQESRLVTELVYGTIQRLNTIDYFLNRFVAKGIDKLQPWVKNLLRLSFYQLYYLDRIPHHAAVNEAVNIAKRKGHQGISGMVNAVLRNIIRQKSQLSLPPDLSSVERIALQHSHPEWMVSRWVKQYGEAAAEQICAANNAAPHVSVRLNAMKTDRDSMINELKRHDMEAVLSTLSPSGIIIKSGGNMALTSWYQRGEFSVQDESSMLVAEIVDPKPGMNVLDCCAAPGGKTTHMAEKMQDKGRIWAADLHEHKRNLIEQQAKRLSLQCIRTLTEDARLLNRHFAEEFFDCILLDAPCSGLGVIRRKPDIKWSKQEDEITEIAKLQFEILTSVTRLLRPGGVIVYSTCTIEFAENQGIVQTFLQENDDFELADFPQHVDLFRNTAGMMQILPHEYHSDGFFIARLRKKTGSLSN